MADPYGGRPSVPHLQPPEDDVVSTFLYHSLYHHNSDSSNHNNNDDNNNSNNNPNAIHNPNHHAPPLLFPVDATSSSGLFPNGVLVAGSGPSSKQPEASSSLNFSDPGSYYFRADVDKIHSGGDFSYVESDVIPDRRENFCDEEAPGSSDTPSPLVVPRTSSKRSRAAEVHNLSEKRRRSKINEKMKALQKLIPNSDKTDKASMLDEAIEYLKQLQLQVQMLTMRNGLNLHPLCLPGVYQPLHVPQGESSLGDGNKLLDTNVGSSSFSMNPETSMRTAFDISNQCTPSDLPVAPTGTNIANAETPYSYTPVFPAHYGPLNLSTSSKEICRENLPRFQVNTSDAGKSSPGISS